MNPAPLKFCPHCGSTGYEYRENKFWYCPVCLFTYYHNVATSASVIIEVDSSFLMLVRSRNPGLGMLSLPGGFVDSDECAEDAAVRECFEETGLISEITSFVGSWPNEYVHKNVTYKTCDFYFSAKLKDSFELIACDPKEISGFKLLSFSEIETAPIAFESHRNAIRAYLTLQNEK